MKQISRSSRPEWLESCGAICTPLEIVTSLLQAAKSILNYEFVVLASTFYKLLRLIGVIDVTMMMFYYNSRLAMD
jgi:hypothetical protein